MPHPPILIPEIGREETNKIKGTINALKELAKEISEISPKTIVLITPHGPMFSDAIAISYGEKLEGDFSKFGSPEVKTSKELDFTLTEAIIEKAIDLDIPIVKITDKTAKTYKIKNELDHGAMVPLYFVNKEFNDYKLVHITYGMLSKLELYKFGIAIKEAIEEGENEAIIIASGDLSHRLSNSGPYEFNPLGKVFDEELLIKLKEGDTRAIFNFDEYMVKEAGECALRSIYILLGALDGIEYKGKVLSYEGTFGVGYGVVNFMTYKESLESQCDLIKVDIENRFKALRKDENMYVKLARESLEYYTKYRKYLKIPTYVCDEMKNNKRGVFVSIKKNGELRGCIGTIFPVTESIAEEIIRNAVEAGVMDPRFNSVDETELNDLVYSVDILMPPIATTTEALDPKKFGVIVRSGRKAGLLLPNLEGIESVKDQIDIALKKANITHSESYTIEKFEVIRYR